jgi:hypothetical protein
LAVGLIGDRFAESRAVFARIAYVLQGRDWMGL